MARRQVSIFINGKEVANNIKAIAGEKRKVVRELNRMTIGTKEYNDKLKELDRLNGVLNTHRTRVRGISSSYDKITAGAKNFLGIAATAFAADKVLEYGKELFRAGVEMDTLERKAATVLGPALNSVKESALENANAMGLTTSQYTDAATAIADVLIPMKFQREEAALMSTQLVDLSGALSEWTGGQRSATDIADILKKALTGEREQLKELGIVIQEADVKARLAEKGLKGLTGELLQQAKAAATLELITEKSVDAQTSFAQNTDSLIRKQQRLQATFKSIQENISSALIPVFGRLLSVAEPFVNLIKEFTTIPLSNKLQQEATDLNLLVSQITEANISQEKRNGLIGTLQSKYPDFLGNLNAETATNEELADRLKEVNNQYIFKIALQQEDEKITAQANIVAEKRRSIAQNEVELTQRMLELNKSLNLGLDFTNKSYEERRQLTLDALQNLADETDSEAKTLSFLRLKSEFGVQINGERETAIEKEERILDTLQKSRKELEKSLALQLGINLEKEKPDDPQAAGGDSNLKDEARSERLRKQQEKDAEREAKALEKKLQRLKEIREQFEQDARLAALTDDERRLAEVRDSFDKQIAIAKELEAKGVKEATAQRIELERLRDNKLQSVRQEIFKTNLEAENLRQEEEERLKDEKHEARLLKEQERAAAEREARTLIETELLSEQDRALLELKIYYENLIALAEKYELDTTKLTDKWKAEKAKLNKEYREKETAEVLKEQQQRAQTQAQAFASLADIAGSALELLGDESSKFAELQRIITLAQLGFKSAEAIANATASAAALPFPGNLAAIASAVATVLTNMAQAKKAFESAPSVPQRRDGGYANVKGAQDGITYKARYIGDPSTGMLPPGPVLTGSGILANEAGQEYFVSNKDLQKPAVANYVRMIENIRMNRVPQRIDGGFGQQDPNQTQEQQAPESSMMSSQLIAVLSQLNATIQQGIIARYDDDEVLKVFDVFQKLDDASGNTLN